MMQIAAARRRTQRLIWKMEQTVGREMAVSIVLSRVTREARRLYGLEGAEHLFQRIAAAMPEGEQVEVIVPNVAFQMGRRDRTVWDVSGMMIQTICAVFAPETAFQIILSSAGVTKPMVHAMVKTMAEVANYDTEP